MKASWCTSVCVGVSGSHWCSKEREKKHLLVCVASCGVWKKRSVRDVLERCVRFLLFLKGDT
jgi:hypothetical protein